ncbi:MAG TPA: FGGY-family carbohydrate kinase [Arachnia sp.]|nr:FGGY-family carbohydrate kinase [Arachnia sp.]
MDDRGSGGGGPRRSQAEEGEGQKEAEAGAGVGLEGTAYAARHILDAMAAAGTTPTRLFSVGGGTTGGLWPQIVSDVTGLAQDITQQSMGACYGDAMLAGVASGIVERDAEWTSVARRVEPNPEAKRVYDELYAVYRELHPRTADLQHRLAALQTSQ